MENTKDKAKDFWNTEEVKDWHKTQFAKPPRSIVFFDNFLAKNADLHEKRILDLGCGGGVAEYYLAKNHPDLSITGVDLVTDSFSIFTEHADNVIKKQVSLEQGDWYNLPDSYKSCFDGVISLQSLSWLEDWKKPIDKIVDLSPKWIALSSLFYEGKINYTIKLEDYEDAEGEGFDIVYYNIYSIPIIRDYLKSKGYNRFIYEKFDIDIDIEKPSHLGTGTYTFKTEEGKRMQMSAALLMPWYFIFASKE